MSTSENTAAEPMTRPKPRGRKRAVLTIDDEHEREERRLAKRRNRYCSSTYVCECEKTVKKDNKQHKRSQGHIRVMEQKRAQEDIIDKLRREELSEAEVRRSIVSLDAGCIPPASMSTTTRSARSAGT
jgi:hypothetical protein